ncbi:carbohydrate ABC transporter permease [Clostridium oryzae]|uniref:Lactose transport system permease protein LacF n=1 Tax=Clostridium oryzae TaxID=1450648 RepID=A0A1V4IJ12_9CLOT|nr:sugar ABC transporter permease [Clostridium oryzae]OPJ59497.1 lactose transport system permease protein LacF [Clostridium oryzae]
METVDIVKEPIIQNKKKKKYNMFRKEERIAYLFIAAPILQFLVFMLGPMIFSVGASFTDWSGIGKMSFIGIKNYINLFNDANFWKSLFNTIFYFIGIPIGMILGLLLAMALNRKIPGVRVFRTIYYIPVVSSAVAVSILWSWVYNSDYGLINGFLSVLGIKGPAWLSDPSTVKPALIGMFVWQGLGNTIVLYLAGLQGISSVYYEAAAIDGANAWHKFRHITVPLITPTSFYLLVTNLIGGFQLYIPITIMTNDGGTNYSSATTVFYLFNKAFKDYQMGYASAVAWILGFVILIVTIINFKFQDKWVNTMN